jgi:hypothetical protein
MEAARLNLSSSWEWVVSFALCHLYSEWWSVYKSGGSKGSKTLIYESHEFGYPNSQQVRCSIRRLPVSWREVTCPHVLKWWMIWGLGPEGGPSYHTDWTRTWTVRRSVPPWSARAQTSFLWWWHIKLLFTYHSLTYFSRQHSYFLFIRRRGRGVPNENLGS